MSTRARLLVLLAALAAAACEYFPPPPPPATPPPTATPAPPSPTPTASPEPSATPTASPTPAPVPTVTPKPTPSPTPHSDAPCRAACLSRLASDVRYGHVVHYGFNAAGFEVLCNDATGAQNCYSRPWCDHVTKEGVKLHGACEWLALAACCAPPPPPPTPTPTATPTPEPGGTPLPGPTPSVCPRLVKWGLADKAFEGTCESGACLFDTTPRFERWPNDQRGGACNGEHDSCGGRKCEDPRGLDESGVTVVGGGEWRLIDGAYKVKVTGSTPPQSITVCPRRDLRDSTGPLDPETGEPTPGRLVEVIGSGCDTRVYR